MSQYSHIKANKDVNGKETIIAAVQVYYFAISDTATIIIALIIVLRKKYIIYSHLFLLLYRHQMYKLKVLQYQLIIIFHLKLTKP